MLSPPPLSPGFSFNLLALLFCAHYILPRSQAYTSKFFTLQYYNERSQKYGLGFDDTYYVFLVVVLFTGLRAAAMEYFLAPFAKYLGLEKKKEVTRFSEQAWLVIYCVVFWALGVVSTYRVLWWTLESCCCCEPTADPLLLLSTSTTIRLRG